MFFLSILVFVITLIFIIWQPKGLKIGTTAVIGAIFAFILGIVNTADILNVVNIVWDATLSFIGIVILSMVLDEIGFFEWCAIKMAKFSKNNGHLMFIYSLILGSIVSAIFGNDGAALILTPILLAKMKLLKLNAKSILAFILAGGFISDSASLLFVFSNLTNIVTANFFHIGFADYLSNMWLPYVVSVVISITLLWLLLKKDIPNYIDTTLLKKEDEVIKSKFLFNFSWFFLICLLGGYFIGDFYKIPVSVCGLSGGLIFLLLASLKKQVNALSIIKKAPWQIVWFSVGLYVVVYGLKNAGLTNEISHLLNYLSQQGSQVAIIGTGFISAFLSSIMNNMPTIMIMDIALQNNPINEAMIYANIIGANLGPKMTPFGSLATLLWLHVLSEKGVKIGFWQYTKFGLLVTPPVLFIVLLSLL
jgi:arsenical pump membrane protein